LRRALRADGLLVNLFNTGAPLSVEVLLEYRSGYAGWVLAELDRLGISVPESREKFSQRLGDYARELESREGAFDQPEQVLALHERAGFAVESCVETDLVMTAPFQQLIVKLTKRRHIIVATPTAIRVGA
jgi:hypothetical protein